MLFTPGSNHLILSKDRKTQGYSMAIILCALGAVSLTEQLPNNALDL